VLTLSSGGARAVEVGREGSRFTLRRWAWFGAEGGSGEGEEGVA
jgi:hypothetical protein